MGFCSFLSVFYYYFFYFPLQKSFKLYDVIVFFLFFFPLFSVFVYYCTLHYIKKKPFKRVYSFLYSTNVSAATLFRNLDLMTHVYRRNVLKYRDMIFPPYRPHPYPDIGLLMNLKKKQKRKKTCLMILSFIPIK